MAFHFLDPGPLVDQELELVPPEPKWFDDLLAAIAHPASTADTRILRITRRQLDEFVRAAPRGHQNGDPETGTSPAYHFWMRLRPALCSPLPAWSIARAGIEPPARICGSIGLRIGQTLDVAMYLGHIGYNVYPFARGNHYAERACRLVMPLALRHGIRPLWITCNPDNAASRRTCERLGCTFVETVTLPPNHVLRHRGDVEKCRYRWDV